MAGGRGALGLSFSSSSSESSTTRRTAEENRVRISGALSSVVPGKLTYGVEVCVRPVLDPTAILLRSTTVATLGSRLKDARANAVLFGRDDRDDDRDDDDDDDHLDLLRTLCQQLSEGFVPVPVLYRWKGPFEGTKEGGATTSRSVTMKDRMTTVADAGASGVLFPWRPRGGNGRETKLVSSIDEIVRTADDDDYGWIRTFCEVALDSGLQPVPEITLNPLFVGSSKSSSWSADDCETIADAVSKSCGAFDPVALVLTVGDVGILDGAPASSSSSSSSLSAATADPPKITTTTSWMERGTSILGSVRRRTTIEDIREAASELKSEDGGKRGGYSGALLRYDCIPTSTTTTTPMTMMTDITTTTTTNHKDDGLARVGTFWSDVLRDLKSAKSKTFAFRSKNNMDTDLPTAWSKLRKSVAESGALGYPEETTSGGGSTDTSSFDASGGDYKGF